MSEIIDLCNKILSEENTKIENIILEYSYKQKILIIFTNNNLYIIDDSKNNPNLKSKISLKFTIKSLSLHPKSQNQLIILTNQDIIYIIPDIKSFSNMEQMIQLNLRSKNIINIKFSYFDNFFGILYDKNKFNLYFLQNKKEEILLTEELDSDYIDFNFCPHFSSGFDLFMIFFMKKNGELNMYGPFFPKEFTINKEYFFNMNNFLLYKLNTGNNNDYQKYEISLAIINDLKNSIIKETKDNYAIKISEKIQKINATFRKREIFINNNFLSNSNMDLLDINYKQIFILEKRPLTMLRISENNNIDIIILSEEIFPELANIGNIISNNDIKINNYLVEFIQLNKNKIKEKNLIKIIQYENEQLFIKTNDSLFLVQIPYLNELKKAVDDNLMFIPNKIKKTSLNKIFKWNQENKNALLFNYNKIIEIKDILIIPELKKICIFGILKEKIKVKEFGNETIKEIKRVIIKESKYKDINNILNKVKFNEIFKPNKKDNIGDDLYNIKLNENDSVKNEIKNIIINVDEKILEDKDNFEEQINNDMNNLYKIYDNLLQKNEELFMNKINIMKNIYNNLSDSKIKENIDETNKKIKALKTTKEKIIKNNEIISQKIENINDKINKYELTDEETENYLKILKKYQKEMNDKLRDIEKRIKFCDENINNNFSFKELFPSNDLDFNFIEKENQKKYMKFEEEINNKSKELYIKIQQ